MQAPLFWMICQKYLIALYMNSIAKFQAYGFVLICPKNLHSYLINRKQKNSLNNTYSSWSYRDSQV